MDLAAAQHGAFSRKQASALGVGADRVRRRIAAGDLLAATSQVLLTRGAPATSHQLVMIEVLDTGAGGCASHDTALGLFRIPGFNTAPVHVTHPRGCNRLDKRGAIVHTSRSLGPDHLAIIDGIPTTTPTRALFDIAATHHPGRVERCLDALWTRRLTDADRLDACLRALHGRGRPGIQLMRELIDARGPGYIAAESGLEGRFHASIREDGQRPFQRQVTVETAEGTFRVDALDDEAMLIVEIDSDLHHRSLSDIAADARRDALLEDLGFVVLRISEHEIWHNADDVARRVRRLRNERRRDRGAPPCRSIA